MLRSWRIGVLALAATTMLAGIESFAQTASSPDDPKGAMIYAVSPEQMTAVLAEAGYTISENGSDFLAIYSPSDQLLFLQLIGCQDDRCTGVRIRARWALGDRPAAIRAAQYYEETVPLAFVSLAPINLGTMLLVGRDVWLSPGRTTHNLIFQIGQVDQMADIVTRMLSTEDPGIVDYWEKLREAPSD